MAEETILARIRPCRGTAIAWTSANPILKLGELGLETDTGKFKAGDGVNLWSVLPYTIGADGTAATISIGTVTGLPSGSEPTVTNSGTPLDAIFDFELPVGDPGITIPDPSGLTTETEIANTDKFLFSRGSSLLNVAWSTIIKQLSSITLNNLISAYSGDTVPSYPDDPAGVTYLNDKTFTTADGWTATRCTLSYSGGKMIVTATGAAPLLTRPVTASRLVVVVFRKLSGNAISSNLSNSSGMIYAEEKGYIADNKLIHSFYIGAGATGDLRFYPGATGSASGDVYEVETIYIGTGAYLSDVKDKNSNFDLIASSVVPVNGKFGKALYLNGATSYLRTSDYFTMPPVFIFACRWLGIENLATEQDIVSIRSATGNAFLLKRSASSTSLLIYYWNGSAFVFVTATSFFTSTAHEIVCAVNRTAGTITVLKDGVPFSSYTGLTIVGVTAAMYLWFGNGYTLASPLKGNLEQIMLFNRALTESEVARYSMGPVLIG